MKNIAVVFVIGLIPLLASCAPAPPLVIDPVGPAPAVQADPNQGYLKVFSETEERSNDDGHYYPHASYAIYGHDGNLYRRIVNGYGTNDQSPDLVTLPVGTYTVEAQASGAGNVKVPVVIEAGLLTSVNLEQDWMKTTPKTDEANWVKLPNGHIVGWRATESASK